jgi:hypothetical protein
LLLKLLSLVSALNWGIWKLIKRQKKYKTRKSKIFYSCKQNLESEFRELKKLCRNVHWIHVKEDSFLWRDTNCNIETIRRYIENIKCEKHNIKRAVGHNDRTRLLVTEPGMRKVHVNFLYFTWNQEMETIGLGINIPNTKNDTDIHLTTESNSVNTFLLISRRKYEVKKGLLTGPTRMTLHRNMFQLQVAIWKLECFCRMTCCYKRR